MDSRARYTGYPEQVEQYFKKLGLLPDGPNVSIRASLWQDLIQFIEDPHYPDRRYISLRQNRERVNAELHAFLRQHGTHYFQEMNLLPRNKTHVYRDNISTDR